MSAEPFADPTPNHCFPLPFPHFRICRIPIFFCSHQKYASPLSETRFSVFGFPLCSLFSVFAFCFCCINFTADPHLESLFGAPQRDPQKCMFWNLKNIKIIVSPQRNNSFGISRVHRAHISISSNMRFDRAKRFLVKVCVVTPRPRRGLATPNELLSSGWASTTATKKRASMIISLWGGPGKNNLAKMLRRSSFSYADFDFDFERGVSSPVTLRSFLYTDKIHYRISRGTTHPEVQFHYRIETCTSDTSRRK